ncbi:MAG: hypothetical protein ACR2MP_34165 [Streptosporangiaceae bacterium]
MTASLENLHRAAVGVTLRMCASDAGVNPDTLLDSRGFLTATDGLDPAAPGFAAEVRSAALAAAETEPGRFRVAQPATDVPRQWTLEDVERAGPTEVVSAVEAGLLRDLGYAPAKRRRG